MLGEANLGAIILGETVLDGTVWEEVITKGTILDTEPISQNFVAVEVVERPSLTGLT